MGRPGWIVLACALALGCARSHLGERGDATPDATPDAAARDMDAGEDAGQPGFDGGPDARVTRWENPDDARQCLERLDLVLEDGWPAPGEPVPHRPDSTGVAVTPLVLPPTRLGERPRLAFVTHGSPGPSERPHPTGRMRAERDGVVRVLDLQTRALVSSDSGELPYLSQTSTLAVHDVDGDGALEIVVPGGSSGLYVLDLSGSVERVIGTPPRPPTTSLGGLRLPISVSGVPVVADLEGDGDQEILMGPCVVEGATGARRFCAPLDEGHGRHQYFGPVVTTFDLDGDGALEILAGRTAYRADGSVMWRAEARAGDDGFAVAGELLAAHPGPEVAFVSESFVYTLAAEDGRRLHVARMLTGVVAGPPIMGAPPTPAYQGGPPLLVDVDLDGTMEIGVVGAYHYHLIEPEDPSPVASVRWSESIRDLSGVAGAMATDLTGDGYPEIVALDERRLRVLDGRTGQARFSASAGSGTRTEYPVVADVDLDGSSEIIVPTAGGLRIYGERESRFTARTEPWMQHGGPGGAGARSVPSDGSGSSTGSPDARSDAWIAWAEASCDESAGELRVGVRNLGGEPMTGSGQLGLAVSSWPEERLADATFDGPIGPGEERVVSLTFVPRVGEHDYYVALAPVDGECNTANNGLALPALRCGD